MPIIVEGVTLPEYNDPADVPASLLSMLAGVLPRIGGTLSGILSMGGFRITNLGTPTATTDAATKAYVDAAGIGAIPSGVLTPFAAPTIPSGWLLCNGQAVSRSTYAALFAAIGITYGAGNGSTTFNLPDLRGRFPMGVAASGTGSALGQAGGSIDHTHTGPSHQHAQGSHQHGWGATTDSQGYHAHGVSTNTGFPNDTVAFGAGSGFVAASGSHVHDAPDTDAAGVHAHNVSGTSDGGNGGTTGFAGTGATSANNPPYLALQFIIKT